MLTVAIAACYLKEISVDEMAEILNKARMDQAKARISKDWGAFRSVTDITTTEVTQRGMTAENEDRINVWRQK